VRFIKKKAALDQTGIIARKMSWSRDSRKGGQRGGGGEKKHKTPGVVFQQRPLEARGRRIS